MLDQQHVIGEDGAKLDVFQIATGRGLGKVIFDMPRVEGVVGNLQKWKALMEGGLNSTRLVVFSLKLEAKD
jgi:hypothetical protein